MPTNISGQAPTQFLVSTIKFATMSVTQTVTDPTSPFDGFPKAYRADFDIQIQGHSDPSTSTPYMYDAFDINIGDWLGQPSGKAYKIIDIIVNDPADTVNYDPGQPDAILDQNNITLEIEDVDLYILKSDISGSGVNAPDEEQQGAIFETDEEDMPILSNITQFSGQFPNISYWAQDIQSRFEFYSVDIEGVPTDVDNDKAVSVVTNGNGSQTGLAIQYTPFADSKVDLKVNGISCNYGIAKDFYFSNDGGVTAKAMADIEAGDELIWNGVNVGYELDSSDDIDLDYEAASNDI
jgi:hypothetical protein